MDNSEVDRQAIYRAWIEDAIKLTGKRPTPFFVEAGLHGSNATRLLKENSTVRITDKTIDRLATHYKIAPPQISAPKDATSRSGPAPGLELIERMSFGDELVYRVRDTSMVLAGYLPGDLVTIRTDIAPEAGDVVVAHIIRADRPMAQPVLRRFQPPYLIAAALDVNGASKPDYVDHEHVRILGTVIRSVRERPENGL